MMRLRKPWSYLLDGGRPAPERRRIEKSHEGAEAGDGLADDQILHLIGAFVGVERLGVREEAGDVVVGDDAVAAQQLAAPRDGLARSSRAERLGERRVMVAELAFIGHLRQPDHQALTG